MGSDRGVPAVEAPATLDILGVSVHCVDFPETLAYLTGWVEEPLPDRVRQICTVNPEFVMTARRDPRFARALGAADLRVPDGIGILWAARLWGRRLRERVTGSDGVDRIASLAARRGWRLFLLGAGPGVAEEAARRLTARYPSLILGGCYAGSPQEEEWPRIRQRLVQARPHILLVAFGHPQQDIWIHRHGRDLAGMVAIGVGGALDFTAGVTRRAPLWARRLGLEWLHRLVRQPWRWRRMLVLPQFAGLVLLDRLRRWRSAGPAGDSGSAI